MKAFVFANDQNPTQEINGLSYAYLPLEGRPILLYVLMALDRVSDIEEITVVGSQKKIMRVIESVMFEMPFQKTIAVLEQKPTLFESMADVNKDRGDGLEMLSEPALFLPGNIPYLTSAEISTFIAASDMRKSDVCLSIASKNALKFFAQKEVTRQNSPSSSQTVRLGNLLIARSESLFKNIVLKTFYEHLKESSYDAKTLEGFFKYPGFNDESKAQKPSLSDLEENLSQYLNLDFKFSETVTAGNTFAVRDHNAYQFVQRQFSDWREQIIELKSEDGEQICSISGTICDSR